MLDDSLLDDPAALQRADQDHALLALAASGARVRTALRLAEAAGVSSLRPEGGRAPSWSPEPAAC